ncbi:OprO/OprP family phosphate-selective porin [Fulvivirga ulvae]|uniref:porin n=1 Tax=Fulvivirga ulvae TaxID=2904245 RepID=UPI001F2F46AD|nr:porin [Fulvivirga ulvae]UII31217.1 OprO/OprP family phosphate-selective porin [Fulvivirga ulvae]
MRKYTMVGALVCILSYTNVHSQNTTDSKFGKGISVVASDSSFSLRFKTRFQTLYTGTYDEGTDSYKDNVMIRRARLKFDGFAYTPRLKYKVELGLSNRDTGGSIPQANNTANIILDAVLKYNFHGRWSVWFGQTKLPGNIERVISSASLQLVDRSNLNSRFNIDRDAGIQLRYESPRFRSSTAISKGEGRNITAANMGGYDYTQRFEWFPFGQFTGKGDYFGADLKRESAPRLMLGVTYDYNDRAARERGQLGSFLSEERTLETWFLDAHFKYRGFSTMVEYANKKAHNGPAIVDETGATIGSFYTGSGINIQSGYLFKNNIELAARYTGVEPDKETGKDKNDQYTVGLSKYIVGHALKIQSDITLIDEEGADSQYMYRFQVEFSL